MKELFLCHIADFFFLTGQFVLVLCKFLFLEQNKNTWVKIIHLCTVCPRRLDPFHKVSYHLTWVKTSWTDSIVYIIGLSLYNFHRFGIGSNEGLAQWYIHILGCILCLNPSAAHGTFIRR